MTVKARYTVESIGLFALCFAWFAMELFRLENLACIDCFYHMAVSDEIAVSPPYVDIRWLPYTLLGRDGVDQHWVWHMLAVPFTVFSDSLTALKLAISGTAALVPVAVNLFLRSYKVSYAPMLAILAVTGSLILPERFLMLKAQNIAIIFYFVFFHGHCSIDDTG